MRREEAHQNIADILVDSEGALDKRNHWEKTSHSLLVGVILHVLYAEADKMLAGVANFLSDPKRPMEATLRAMMSTPHLGEAGVHPLLADRDPPLPDSAQASARAKDVERFDGFLQSLGRRLATGDRFLKELSRDVDAYDQAKSEAE